MFKNIFCLIVMFFCVFITVGQNSGIDIDLEVKEKIDKIEIEISEYTSDNIDDYVIDDELVKEALQNAEGDLTTEMENEIILNLKRQKLRSEFFFQNPDKLDYYIDIPIAFHCSPEAQVANYTFFSESVSMSDFEKCNNDPTEGPSVIPPFPVNEPDEKVSLVSSGNDPTLDSYGITVSRTLNSAKSIRLNDVLQGGKDVTIMRKRINNVTTEDLNINFSLVLENPGGSHNELEPYLNIRLLNENMEVVGGVGNEYCISTEDFQSNCVFKTTGDGKFFYTDWTCASFDSYDVIGEAAFIEVAVGDCGRNGHKGYVYIDGCMDQSCDGGISGNIKLDDVERDCPSLPMEICGELFPPADAEGNLGSLNAVVAEVNNQIVNPVITINQDNTFCVDLDENDLPNNLAGDVEVKLIAQYEMECMDVGGEEYFEVTRRIILNFDNCEPLWPRTYGGENHYKRFSSDIAVDEEENVYTVGNLDFDDFSYEDGSFNSTFRGYVMKHDKDGELLWNKELPEFVDSNNGRFITVEYNQDKIYVGLDGHLVIYDVVSGTQLLNYQVIPQGRFNTEIDQNGNIILSTITNLNSFFIENMPSYAINPGKSIVLFKFNQYGSFLSKKQFPISYESSRIPALTTTYSDSKILLSFKKDDHPIGYKVMYNSYLGFGSHSSVYLDDFDRVGKLAYDDVNQELYAEVNSSGQIVKFDQDFSGNYQVFYSAFSGWLTDLSFENTSNRILASTKNKVISKPVGGGLLKYATISSLGFIKATVSKNQNYYITGDYIGEALQGADLLPPYPNSGSSQFIFITRPTMLNGMIGTPIGLGSSNKNRFYISPNPVDNRFEIVNDNFKGKIRFEILDINGKVQNYQIGNSDNEVIIDDYDTGIYFLKIYDDNRELQTVRIMKK